MDVLDPISDPDLWDRQVSSHPDATIFHSAAWAKVLSRTYGHNPHYLRLNGHDGEPAALIPIMELRSPITGRRGVCLPFSDLCSPLLFEGCDQQAVRDRLAALAHQRRWKYLELRGNSLTSSSSNTNTDTSRPSSDLRPPTPDLRPLTSDLRPPTSDLCCLPTFFGHQLDLTIGTSALLAGCSSSVRRALRKAERSHLTVNIDQSPAAMRGFFRLHTCTRRRHGLPPQPFRFFQIIREELISKDLGFIVLASHRERKNPIAAAVFLRNGTSAIYKFGASDESEWSLRPNNLIMWEAIRHLAESGAKHLLLGRTAPELEGLRRFKLSWGTREEPINYCQYQTQTSSWRPIPDTASTLSLRLAHKIFRHVPLPVNRLAGKLIFPHLD